MRSSACHARRHGRHQTKCQLEGDKVGEVFGTPCPQTWTPSDEVKHQIFGVVVIIMMYLFYGSVEKPNICARPKMSLKH